jgi:signal peptidase
MAIPSFFVWFSPILPDLTWAIKPLISVVVASMGYLILDETKVVRDTQNFKSRFMRRKSIKSSWLIVGLVGLIAVWGATGMFGFKPTVIVSESMTPDFQVGDMPIVLPVQTSSIAVGDVIQFMKGNVPVVHRVVEIQTVQGAFWFVTKGDANDAPDSELVSESAVVGKVVFNIPKIGWISLGLREFGSILYSSGSQIALSLSEFGSWLFTKGVYLTLALAAGAFALLCYSVNDEFRKMSR